MKSPLDAHSEIRSLQFPLLDQLGRDCHRQLDRDRKTDPFIDP